VVTYPDYPRLIPLILFEGGLDLAGPPYPELALFVEQERIDDEIVQFAELVSVLRR